MTQPPGPTNAYSAAWFRAFMDPIPASVTALEIAAIASRVPTGAEILDICCGTGRHAGPLAEAGYSVTGIDRDARALTAATRAAPGARFVALDMRHLDAFRERSFDTAMVLWQSFGYFSPRDNDAVLASIARLLRPGGVALLDVVHPTWYRARLGRSDDPRDGVASISTAFVRERLISTIEYSDGWTEAFDFEMFLPHELAMRASSAGLSLRETCVWWDPSRPADGSEARYQLVLHRD